MLPEDLKTFTTDIYLLTIIRHAMKITQTTDEDLPIIRELFLEYQKQIGVNLTFQNFEDELNALPGAYASPDGSLFLARNNGQIAGCIGVRPRVGEEAELKRLFVRPEHQGSGIGYQLFVTAMQAAQAMGYRSIVLDTLPAMEAAKSLYINYGFIEIPAYYDNPEVGAQYYRYLFN